MWKLIFSGVGGQGVITAAILTAEAAVIHEKRHAVQTQTYGARARGGLTRADVTISDTEIYYPKVEQAHVLMCLHQDAYYRNVALIRPGGILIVDAEGVSVDRNVDARTHSLPFRRTAVEVGNPQGANMAVIGSLVTLTKVVQPESVRAAIRARFGDPATGPHATANLRAFDAGLELPNREPARAPAP
ncbi:MAG: 2-oxoacid:acceptor oxidoreductase family protein [bacterium]